MKKLCGKSFKSSFLHVGRKWFDLQSCTRSRPNKNYNVKCKQLSYFKNKLCQESIAIVNITVKNILRRRNLDGCYRRPFRHCPGTRPFWQHWRPLCWVCLISTELFFQKRPPKRKRSQTHESRRESICTDWTEPLPTVATTAARARPRVTATATCEENIDQKEAI